MRYRYRLVNQNGEIAETTNLYQWCKQRRMQSDRMIKQSRKGGYYLGWRIEEKTPHREKKKISPIQSKAITNIRNEFLDVIQTHRDLYHVNPYE